MSSPLAGGGDGNTPLDPNEAEGLRPAWIATRADLDRAEHENVRKRHEWARRVHARRESIRRACRGRAKRQLIKELNAPDPFNIYSRGTSAWPPARWSLIGYPNWV